MSQAMQLTPAMILNGVPSFLGWCLEDGDVQNFWLLSV